MSWVLVRRREEEFEMYRDADIYGYNGHWLPNKHCCDLKELARYLPHQFAMKCEADIRLEEEQKKDPGWDYAVEYYE